MNLTTFTNKTVNLNNIDPETLNLTDVFHSLNQTQRFCAQRLVTLTVLEHSMWVAAKLWLDTSEPACALAGLLHDASEAYIADIPSPVKQLPELDGYRQIETRIMNVFATKHNLDFTDPRIEAADKLCYAKEEEIAALYEDVRDSITKVTSPMPSSSTCIPERAESFFRTLDSLRDGTCENVEQTTEILDGFCKKVIVGFDERKTAHDEMIKVSEAIKVLMGSPMLEAFLKNFGDK